MVARDFPPRFLGPPARQEAPPPQAQSPPSFGAAPVAQPAFQQQPRPPPPPPQIQQPPTAMMQQMSLQQQQQQRPPYPPPPQHQQIRPRPPSFAAGPPPPPPPPRPGLVPQQLQQRPQMMPPQMQQQQPQQQLRGPTTMLPPPPPAFGGVVVSGGGGTAGGTPSAAAGASYSSSSSSAPHPFAPPGPPQRIDPSQIPRPTAAAAAVTDAASAASASSSLRPVTHRTRSAPRQQQQDGFSQQQQQLQQQDRHVPPPPTSAFADCPGVAVSDGGDASFRAMRPTLHAFPRTRDLAKSIGIPLAVLVTPLAAPLPGDDAIPLLDFGAAGPPRCQGCRAYINPGFVPLDGGASFGCNLCGEVSTVPLEYSAAGGGARVVGAVGSRGSGEADAALERAALDSSSSCSGLPPPALELERGTFEFLAPPAFCARAPRPPARLFVIDASFGSGSCGLTAASCRAVAAAIRAVAAQAKESREAEVERERRLFAASGGAAPGSSVASSAPPTLVGLMSFGAAGLHFYSFGTGGGESGGEARGEKGGESSEELLSTSMEPSVLVVPDVDSPFSPAGKGLFVDISPGPFSERRLAALLSLLEKIPALHGVGVASATSNSDPSSSSSSSRLLADPAAPSGAALAAGAATLASVGGGRLHAFLGSVGSAGPRAGALSLPRRGGDGAGAGVASHHFSSHSFDDDAGSVDDAPPLQKPPAPWRALGEFAAERQVGIDVHLSPPRGTRPDGAGARAAAALCSATGGAMHFLPRWAPPPAGVVDDLSEGAVEAVGCGVGATREGGGGGRDPRAPSPSFLFFEPGVAHGWEAVGRLRVSKGIDVLSYSGPVHRRTPLDVDFPCLGPSTTVAAELGHDGSLSTDARGFGAGQAVLQFAVAFTHAASGSRRVRVHTLRLPVAAAEGAAAQVFRGADADALLACGAREVAQALRGSRKGAAAASGGNASASSVVPAAAGLLLKAGSSASLAGGADPSALPASIVAPSSSAAGAANSNAPALPAAALAEAADEALSKARERARACVVAPLASYRERCAATAAGGQLILPEALKLAPLAALALSKHPAVAARGSGGGAAAGLPPASSPAPPQDERAAAAAALARATPASLSRDLTPRLLPLHLLLEAALGGGGGQQQQGQGRKSLLAAAASLAPLPLSAEAVDASGVYCLISDSAVVLHAGGRADPRLVEALGMHMHRSGSGGSGSSGFVVKVPGSAASRALWEMVDEVRSFFLFSFSFLFLPTSFFCSFLLEIFFSLDSSFN